MAVQSLGRYADVRTFAIRSAGFVTADELRELGVPRSTVTRWCRTGLLYRIRRGVYRTSGARFGFDEAVHLASKVMSERHGIGGRSALSVWDLPGGSRGRVEVVGPPGSSFKCAQIKATEHRDLALDDLVIQERIRVTTPIRSIIDASVACSTSQIGAQLSDGVKRGLFTYRELAERVLDVSNSGKQGVAKLRAVLSTRVDGIRELNGYEKAALRVFRVARVPDPVAQNRLEVGVRTYFVDFAWPEHQLLVECDSMLAHSTPEQLQSDLRRQNDLVSMGWRLVRFTYWDIAERHEYVTAVLSKYLPMC